MASATQGPLVGPRCVASVAVLSLAASELGALCAVGISLPAPTWGRRLALHTLLREARRGAERWTQDGARRRARAGSISACAKWWCPRCAPCGWGAPQSSLASSRVSPYFSVLDVLGVNAVVGGISLESLSDWPLRVFRHSAPHAHGVVDTGL